MQNIESKESEPGEASLEYLSFMVPYLLGGTFFSAIAVSELWARQGLLITVWGGIFAFFMLGGCSGLGCYTAYRFINFCVKLYKQRRTAT